MLDEWALKETIVNANVKEKIEIAIDVLRDVLDEDGGDDEPPSPPKRPRPLLGPGLAKVILFPSPPRKPPPNNRGVNLGLLRGQGHD